MTRNERQLRDEIVAAALACHRAPDCDENWEAGQDRLWDATEKLDKELKRKAIRVAGGRPPHPRASEIVAAVREGKLSAIQIAAKYGCHRNSVYRYATVLAEIDDAEQAGK